MPKEVNYRKTERMSFARHEEIQSMPNLLEIQKNSYKWFLEEGLRDVFKDVDVITDYSGNLELRFVDYSMDENPKYTEEECKARDATYAAPLKVSVRLRNKETEEIKEQEIFMGDFPIMTPSGTFVINGAERVIVSQIVRSPGVYYDKKTDKAYNSTYGTTVIPYHGAWLEYETDLNDIFNCRIDKNRKLPVTWFIKAMGAYKADNPAEGRSAVTGNDAERFNFKVPTLRNVELTYPYFHDGAADTLTQAVDTMGRLQLGKKFTPEENADIVAFLKTLTGDQPKFTLPILPPSSDKTKRPQPFE